MGIDKRFYKVLSAEDAVKVGCKVYSNNPYNNHALVAMRGDKLDTMIGWFMRSEPAQNIADKRNKDLAMLQKMVGKASEDMDNNETDGE